jgi:hypothetical protein
MRRITATLAASLIAGALACAPAIRSTATGPLSRLEQAEFWRDPGNIEKQDTFWGPWGQRYAPKSGASFTYVKEKTTGYSPGWTVKDDRGTTWSVKQGPEAHTEVAVSRILSALGFHQPPVYYVDRWTKIGGPGEAQQDGARFRPKNIGLEDKGTWSWQQNPFVGTPAYGGLLALMMLFNETDLKNDNNAVYELDRSLRESNGGVRKWYVVQDVGAALGETGRLNPIRGDEPTFESVGFVLGVSRDRVRFDYHGRHQEVIRQLKPADLRWMMARVSRLSRSQWVAAFRAAGYGEEYSRKFTDIIERRLEEARRALASAAS